MPETEVFAGWCVLTNCNVWSPDSKWVVFDIRSDAAGSVFDGTQIRMVNVETRKVKTVYESRNGANCGVVTFHPTEPLIAFIQGPEFPTSEYSYGPSKRHGVVARCPPLPWGGGAGGEGDSCETSSVCSPDVIGPDSPSPLPLSPREEGFQPIAPLDARDLSPPFTPGALRGGSHVHVWDPTGERVSFTYEDDITAPGLRTVGVTDYLTRVTVPKTHPRNHDGGFSFLVAKVVPNPKPGSDEIGRAVEEGWIGSHSLAFQGFVVPERGGDVIPEVFAVDLPAGNIAPGDGPLEGTLTELPAPPRGVRQRRLTFTSNDPYPGIFGPRHWLRSSPDGSRIAFLKRDARGVVQLFAISPSGGEPQQVTDSEFPMASAFTWHPDGARLAIVIDHSVCLVDMTTGGITRLTPRTDISPRPEACVVSPDGRRVAFVRHRDGVNRLCVVTDF